MAIVSCAFIAASVALSACGSSSSSSSHAPAASASPSTGGKKPFVLGMICSCTGPESAAVGNNISVIQAWADSVNASGGIDGYPVKVITMDDQQNAATSLQEAKAIVEQDHAMAS